MKTIGAMIFTGLLSACTFGRLTNDAPYPSPHEAYFVMGVTGEDSQIGIYDGSVADGIFKVSTATYIGKPAGGFIVGKVPPDRPLAIVHYSLNHSKKENLKHAAACDGVRTMVFTVPAGKVTYVGDVILKSVGKKIAVTTSFNPAPARRYVDEHFAALRGRTEVGSYTTLPTNQSCISATYR